MTHNVQSRRVINACEILIAFQGSLLSVFVGCLGLSLFYLPISLHDSIKKKYNAQVCERTLVRIEISHPHYRTTRSAVPCACCSIISHSSRVYISFVHSDKLYFCNFKYLKSVIALKPCAASVWCPILLYMFTLSFIYNCLHAIESDYYFQFFYWQANKKYEELWCDNVPLKTILLSLTLFYSFWHRGLLTCYIFLLS